MKLNKSKRKKKRNEEGHVNSIHLHLLKKDGKTYSSLPSIHPEK